MRATSLTSPPEPLASAFQACRRHLVYAAIFSALVNLLYLAPTIYLMQVYDRVLPTGGMMTLVWMSLLALVAFAVLGVLSDLRGRLLARASLRLERRLAPEILERMFAAKPLNAKEPPGLRARVLRDFDNFRQTLTGPGVAALMDAPWTPIYILVSFILHPMIGIVSTASSALLIALAILNERATRATLHKANDVLVEAHAIQEGVNRRSDVARALGMARPLARQQLARREQGVGLQLAAQMRGGVYTNTIKALRLIFQSAVLAVAAVLAVRQEISPGAIIAASLLMGRALAPIDQLVGAWNGLVQGRDAYQNLITLFTEFPARPARIELPAPKGKVDVAGLIVATAPDRAILNGISFTLEPGEFIGLVGPSGSGKTTLLATLAGARARTAGDLRVDGASVDDWDSERLAGFIGYLPQDSGLLAGSIRDNVSRFAVHGGADPAAVDAAVIEAATIAGAHDMILQLPGGYDAVLGPGGQGLSAGQAQRVALARALFGSPVILLLDEPNAHLDPEGQAAMMSALKAAKDRGAAIIMSAHRLNAFSFADRLMVMRGGRIEALGPTQEIAKRLTPPTAASKTTAAES